MRTNKAGLRSIKLHDPAAIEMVETLSKIKKIPLFEVAELLIVNTDLDLSTNVAPVEEKDVPKIIIDKFRYIDVIESLIRNDYDLTITHADDQLCITFEERKDKRNGLQSINSR